MSLLVSEKRLFPLLSGELLEGNGYEVWDREEVIRILGKAQLSSGNPPEEAEDDDENALPLWIQTQYCLTEWNFRTILETLRIEGITRPVFSKSGPGRPLPRWLPMLERMAGCDRNRESRGTGLFHSMAEQGRSTSSWKEWSGLEGGAKKATRGTR